MIIPFRLGATIHAVDLGDRDVTLCFKPIPSGKGQGLPLWVPYTCEGCKEVLLKPRYAFCENVTASSSSPIHLRVLSGLGLRVNGGADTMALCGNHVAWDLPGPVNEATLADGRTCQRCLTLHREATKLLR